MREHELIKTKQLAAESVATAHDEAQALLEISWSEQLLRYDFGPGHPMVPIRTELALLLARELGLLDNPRVRQYEPELSLDPQLLAQVHTPDFIAAVQAEQPNAEFGLGTDDIPLFPHMHEKSAAVTAATLSATEAVFKGRARRGLALVGGLHHAMKSKASGFCVYNDPAVAITWLLNQGVERVAYVDIDVHHGDGVQQIFWDDPRVLTVSIHESGDSLFPGTGAAREVGGAGAEGTAVNIALPYGTEDEHWLLAFDSIVPQVLEEFAPDFLVTQHGCDAHAQDPLAHLRLSIEAMTASYQSLREYAETFSQGRWIATGGGGYNPIDVVPRAWAQLIAVMSDQDLPAATPMPEGYVQLVRERLGCGVPPFLGDGVEFTRQDPQQGRDPGSDIDMAIRATEREVFPHLGILPFGY